MSSGRVRVPPFPVPSPLIGMIHLRPLPGSPRFDGRMDAVIAAAARDLHALQAGGVDGVLIENYGDVPFEPGPVGPETVAAMACVLERLRPTLRVPFGFNVLRNDVRSALGLCAATGGAYVRVNVHVGAMVTDQGVIQGRAHETLRERARIAPWVRIWADVGVKHAAPLAARPLVQEAEDLWARGLADAVILTGAATGQPIDAATPAEIKRRLPRVPLIAGSGVSRANLAAFAPWCDAFIVGTALKCRGAIDRARVAALARQLSGLRPGRGRS